MTIDNLMTKNNALHAEKILILDFGSQYTQLIARRLREIGVYCELHSHDWSLEQIQQFNPRGIILSGGPESVTQADPLLPLNYLTQLAAIAPVPILGICYGMQAMAQQWGGVVSAGGSGEFGHADLHLSSALEQPHRLFAGVPASSRAWMSHGDKVTRLPTDFVTLASTSTTPIAAMAHRTQPWIGLQFHPEVTHTDCGLTLLKNFALNICGCQGLWKPTAIIEQMILDVRAQIGDEQVLLGLSGGVDSSVVAALLHRAIGDQLVCVFVDNGLLRLGEAEQVMTTFADHLGVRVIHVNAAEQFLSRLKGIEDPEQKRKIIGTTFIDVFDAQAQQLPQVSWLAQGTIYPDVIESAASQTGKAHVIKSHHNVGGLPETMKLKLLEPLRELFKDEVRTIGRELGLASILVDRHPFPGPGLGVRILGEVKAEYADILREADAIFIDELRSSGWYSRVSQAFVVFLPVKSVGVVGDGRRYQYVVSLRAVETTDFMTATAAALPHDLLNRVSTRIINQVPGIARVVYDISSKPPATIEWE
jgi:GMP synthase (glutamine-hydrolysing)